ncbi:MULTISPECIES: FumA C-terminus/TtdB family hydratase beta subunit [Thermotoga]|uniref:Hydro-lyase, Fe-S type, tartrate/fumarate subfamily, beta subunit n=1 Tax=Thermotoga petrophila (strain ATCC BAA-488 / DSM 13995 / JCM 10881 / RKU-1) TaxID=390874 RepID=A5IJN3_THEP1|nr:MULTISPECIES: FumA C-terminus/TtdB family hydratase beta subunit [Thermotoga]HBF69771.1 TRZ/ATZ family protein [Thermotoga sp.]ABQ46406.1 hydro-lyase, Fe-S type, tartrate/fumarate subfamily, beta subunit [Thermotoga petrophila RKU-1]ACB08752.1 hydro-lyase, Fe-S type, tartrate/fumarate subfamily, beta subunit [Thermotoga sp. RQ2]AIY87750.1 tartrate/fumarate subfamily Fe-S type hydro-lyase subunit beta [Thermotoga sp. Cell2]KHC92195.1 tartrate/fumarate subfamily Fe-S type hydro-lyase subunit 
MRIEDLKAGQEIRYSGKLIVMRDQAQRRLKEIVDRGEEPPVDLRGQIVFYAGPAKTPSGKPVGAIGPTTSARMDDYLEMLFKLGAIATIGKGKRSKKAIEACKKWKRVYFVTPSGTAAALSKRVKKSRVLAFEDLGPEAIYEIEVEDFPLIVAIDSSGNTIFKE